MPIRRVGAHSLSSAPGRPSSILSEESIRALPVRNRAASPSGVDAMAPSSPGPDETNNRPTRSGPNWDEEGHYKVGKGRPPVHSRFQPGRSGNPKGRKPGGRGRTAQARQILGDKMPVKIRGKARKLDAYGIALSVALDKAAKGDLKAIELILRHYREVFPDAPPEVEEELSREERVLIDNFLNSAGIGSDPVVREKRRRDEVRDPERDVLGDEDTEDYEARS